MFKYLWSLIQSYNNKSSPTGVLNDERPSYKKERDYLHEETWMAASLSNVRFGFPKISYPPFTYFYQAGTSSCVPHGVIAVALGYEIYKKTGKWIDLSPIYAYRQRSVYPKEGSWMQDIFDIGRNGVCLYDSLKTPHTETEANAVVLTEAMKNEAQILDGLEYYQLKNDFNDIDELAKISAHNTAVPILIYAEVNEWAQEYPVIINQSLELSKATIRHCVTILPNSGFTEKSVDYVTVQDSSPFGGFKIRHLSRDFIRKRCYGAGYWKQVDMNPGLGVKPVHTFVTPMKHGSSGVEVVWLQKALVYEGLLPADCVTGYFGGRTLAAVRIFQDKYRDEILVPVGLSEPTGSVYNQTLKQLNKLFSA